MRRLIVLAIALLIAAPAAQAQKKGEAPQSDFPTDSLGRILLARESFGFLWASRG